MAARREGRADVGAESNAKEAAACDGIKGEDS